MALTLGSLSAVLLCGKIFFSILHTDVLARSMP